MRVVLPAATVAIDLPVEPESARRARQQLKPFRDAVDATSFVDLCLLVDELVVEALHGEHSPSGRIELRAELDGDRVKVARVRSSRKGAPDKDPSRQTAGGYPCGWGQEEQAGLAARTGQDLRSAPEVLK